MNRGLLAPALPFGCMFQSSVAKLPFAATKTIIKAITRFNNGLNIKAIATAAAPPPNTAFVVQKAMPTNFAFSPGFFGCFVWFYGMQQNLRYGAGLTKAPYLYTGYVSEIDGQPHGFGMKSSAHHSKEILYSLYEEGEWRNGKLNGPAVRMLFSISGWCETLAGLFVDGEPSKCRVVNNFGVIFEGVFEGGDPKNGSFFTPSGVVGARVESTSDYNKKQWSMWWDMKEVRPEYPVSILKAPFSFAISSAPPCHECSFTLVSHPSADAPLLLPRRLKKHIHRLGASLALQQPGIRPRLSQIRRWRASGGGVLQRQLTRLRQVRMRAAKREPSLILCMFQVQIRVRRGIHWSFCWWQKEWQRIIYGIRE